MMAIDRLDSDTGPKGETRASPPSNATGGDASDQPLAEAGKTATPAEGIGGPTHAALDGPLEGAGAVAAGKPIPIEAQALATRRPLKSNQLDRTLAELENAFAAWDSITDDRPLKVAPVTAKAPENNPGENDFRSKTRKLLSQLRDQLADLSED